MKEKKDIKWISLQPLTGGMFLGFMEAIGHPAECIISYKGLNEYHPGKDGKRGRAGNEYNLMQYLKKKGLNVPRFEFAGLSMFDYIDPWEDNIAWGADTDTPAEAVRDTIIDDIDIVCAVPVCSGLSALTATDSCDKERKNCNMKFLAEFALKVIKPKIYIFENAPGFMGGKGDVIREWFEELAFNTQYSVTYFKTDTKLHHNCQKRPRTFVMFTKWNGNEAQRAPETPFWEDVQLDIRDVLSNIPDDATYQDSLPVPLYENVTTIEYARDVWGDNWREAFKGDVMLKIIKNNWLADFKAWCSRREGRFYERMMKHIDHIVDSQEKGKGWWSSTPRYYDHNMAAVQSRTIYATIHPTEDRLCSERDMLTFMGMPYDFEMQGAFMSDGPKIGQNVPVKTAKWIADVAVRTLGMINDERVPGCATRFYDNTKQQVVW